MNKVRKYLKKSPKKQHFRLFDVEGVGTLEAILDLYLHMELAH